MKHPLSCLLLCFLCSLSSWGISGTLVVTQSPDTVTVKEGDSVTIKCCWNLNITRWTVNWIKDNASIVENKLTNKSQCQVYQQKGTCKCADLIISNTSSKYAGTIICKLSLEIPSLKQSIGRGTRITVRTNLNTTGQPDPTLPLHVVIQLTILIPLFLIVMTLIYLWRLRNRQHVGSEGAARVIYRTPHLNSEELEIEDLEVDGHSTGSSRGSTQWCQVLVYESCNYFERVEDKVNK